MGMQSRINLYAVSKSSSFLEGLESLINKDNEIHLWRCCRNLNELLSEFKSRDSSLLNNNVIFIDNLSLDKTETINLLRNFQSGFRLNKAKAIVYTGSCDAGYLTELKELNVDGILHDEESPIRDILLKAGDQIKDNSEISLPYNDVCEKFISTIKLVSSGAVCYDERVSAIINEHNWARRDIERNNMCLGCKGYSKDLPAAKFKLKSAEKVIKFATGHNKFKALILSTVPLMAAGIISLLSDDAFINFDTKKHIDINDGHPNGSLCEKTEVVNYDLIIYDDNGNTNEKDSLLGFLCSGNKSNNLSYQIDDINKTTYETPGVMEQWNNEFEQFTSCLRTGYGRQVIFHYSQPEVKAKGSSTFRGYPCLEKNTPTSRVFVRGRNKPGTKVILYTRSDDILYLRRLKEQGQVGMLHKTSLKEIFVVAINEFYKGNNYLDPAIDKKINGYNEYLSTHPLSKLTHCQLKVLNEVAEGWKNHRIAENLSVTIKDIEKHKTDLSHKLNIKAEELGHFAIEYKDEIKYLLEFLLDA